MNGHSFQVIEVLRSKNHIHRFCSRIEREADASYRDLRLADVLKEIKGDDNLAGNFGRETFHHLTAALRYLPYLESFSCIDWTPEYPGDLFPIMVNLCPKMRKLEVGLIPQARPMGFNGEHVNSYDGSYIFFATQLQCNERCVLDRI